MSAKEAKARIKINQLLQEAGWRFFDSEEGPANISLEHNTRITPAEFENLGDDFQKSKNGFIDFLLLDQNGYPIIILEAKSEDKDPLVGKEQARKYARAQNCRFVILSNGNIHYFWDLDHGNPDVMTRFPEPGSVESRRTYKPDPDRLMNEPVNADYIALTQLPAYAIDPSYRDPESRAAFITENKLKFLREYQLAAVRSIQSAVRDGSSRFLFEMATGTGKTLVSSAVIKLFLRTGNARRILFLVDRIELENQASNAFKNQLENDYTAVIYKESRDDWRNAEIVVSTVQSLLVNNKYRRIFSPTDFDLVISDEAHRSIGGNARALFEYFIGYKLGLTATPKDYLKKAVRDDDPRSYERRIMLDTYTTFGCESGQPTFRYSLIDGVRDGFLINPIVVDARTGITAKLLSDQGYAVTVAAENSEDAVEEVFSHKHFEKTFFSDDTNRVFCLAFMQNALRDPISNEIGKSIIFTVSQKHAAKITQMLNQLADQYFPGRYNSDFAMQVTSHVQDAQQFTLNFSNNNLSGSGNIIPGYKTSKTRVCVTVGMMTTGYDCSDILNLCLMRPVFSPTDFIQIKGRGTRKHSFTNDLFDPALKEQIGRHDKTAFKLFDFFANCEYFEEHFNYDQVLTLPVKSSGSAAGNETSPPAHTDGAYIYSGIDAIESIHEAQIGFQGMKIDSMFFNRFEDKVRDDDFIKQNLPIGNWEAITDYLNREILNKPEDFFTLEKLRKSAGVDRRISLREILEKVFGLIPGFRTKEQLLDEEFDKFIAIYKPDETASLAPMKYFFRAYVLDFRVRDAIDNGRFNDLFTNPGFSAADYKAVPQRWRSVIPAYIKDYLPLNQFM